MSKVFLTKYGKTIENAVNDKNRLRIFIKHIENYFDKNSEILFSQGPSKPLIFGLLDKKAVYDFVSLTESEVEDTVKTIPEINKFRKIANDKFIMLSVFIIRQFEISKMSRERDLMLMFLSSKSYSVRQKISFKYGANENIMAYTINNLSDKYKFKTLKNNYAVIKDVAVQSHSTYNKLLIEGTDYMVNTYFSQLNDRIAKVMNNIADEYYRNFENKNYLNTLRTHDDDTGNHLDYESSSSLIQELAEGTTNFFITSTVNSSIARKVADKNKIPFISVYQTLIEIRKNEKPQDLLNFMSSIIESIYETDNSILSRVCSTDFALTAIKQLSISNSSSKALATVKSELDRMLDTYCSKYAMTERLATKMSYRNAIYNYIVYIMIANKCR
ncbi:MAG: hypothetical protein [Bacteriophage sp.]|nr:MAG: hypothetical protein [Bacteriophage sp.]